MEPGAEKPPSSDAPSLKIKTVSPESEHVELPERSSVRYLKERQRILRRFKTRMQAGNQPDRSSSDTTSSDSNAPQSEKGCYNQDGGESSQTSSVRRRRKVPSYVHPLRFFGGTPFNLRRPASQIRPEAPVPLTLNFSKRTSAKAPLPRGTASTSSDSEILEGTSSYSVSSRPVPTPTVIHRPPPLSASIHYQSPLGWGYWDENYSPAPLRRFLLSSRSMFDPLYMLPSAESSHRVTLPPVFTDISGGGSVVHHSSRAGEKPEKQTICSEPESSPGSSIRSEDTQTTSDFYGLHKYTKSVPESGSTDLSSTQSGGYGGLHRLNMDPEGHGWRTAQMFHKDPVFEPLNPEPTEITCLQLPPASPKESNLSPAATAVPSTTLKDLEFSSIREDLSFPSFLPNRNQTDDADPIASMSVWGSRDNEFYLSMLFENASGAESDYQMETETSATNLAFSLLSSFPASLPRSSDTRLRHYERTSGCLTRCVSAPSLSEIPPPMAPHSTVTQAKSLPNMHFRSSFEDFTPEITVELNEETFWLRCSCPGLYRCRVTGLVFHMTGDGVVVYRVVPWNRSLLAQHHKQPAGPLFDIKCEQRSVRQLYLPHCEIYSTGGCHFLSVAHVEDEGIEFIAPQKVTMTHIIISITRFSEFGIIKDEESPPEPVRALVLLFYRPPSSSDNSSLLNVLLLPRNVVLRDVVHSRKKLVGDESYIETFSRCKLWPKEEYTLSTRPADDTVLVEPTEAEFDSDNYDNYIPSFQVSLETAMKHIQLFLKDSSQSSVWQKRVPLSVSAVNQQRSPSDRNGPSPERLLDVRIGLIDGVSGPVLKSLLDKLFDKKVITDSEREEAGGIQNRKDRNRFVIDTVRKKGEAASSEMIKILCEDDPYLCKNLGLI